MSSQSKNNGMLILAVLTFLFIVLFDFINSGKYILSAFYIVPISLLAWHSGKKYAIPLAFFCAAMGVLISFKGNQHSDVYIFNMIINCVTYFGFAYSISKLKTLFENEKSLARIDYLTGIPNWKAFSETLEREIERAKRAKQTLSLAYIDCDNFKYINDEFGHNEGNNALRVIASTMENNIRKTDYVARIGGDEFVVLLTGANAKDSCIIVEKIKNLLNKEMKNNNYPVTFSIGLSTFEDVPDSAEEMIKFSDVLMYEVKNTSKDSIRSEVIPKDPIFAHI